MTTGLALRRLRVAGYRSLRSVAFDVGNPTVVLGANGTGKTNLYRALGLLVAAARGELGAAVAAEGGMPSACWAGAHAQRPVRLSVGVSLDDWDYTLTLGLHGPPPEPFPWDPLVVEETLTLPGPRRRRVAMLERRRRSAWQRDVEGRRVEYPAQLLLSEAALHQIREAHLYPELALVRDTIGSAWRLYHGFACDEQAPARQPSVDTFTGVLDPAGTGLAAALKTIRKVGDAKGLDAAVERAFPDARLLLEEQGGRVALLLATPGLVRPLRAAELSDGTLRYLCLIAALMPVRAPALIALNEPEASLHGGLIPCLAELLVAASRHSQIWLTTHDVELARLVREAPGSTVVRLERSDEDGTILA